MRYAKRVAAALVLLTRLTGGCASPAWAEEEAAAVKYVSPTGTANWADANFSSNPAPLSAANANATFGTTVQMLDGTYSTSVAPNATGVVFIGNVTDPTKVVVPSVTFKADMSVSYIKTTGSMSVSDFADRAKADRCSIGVDLSLDTPDDCRFTNLTINGGLYIAKSNSGGVKWAMRDTVSDVVMPSKSTNSWMRFTTGLSDNANFSGTYACVFRNIRMVTTCSASTPSGWAPVKLFHSAASRYDNIHVTHTTTSVQAEQANYIWVIRDSSAGNTFNRDTLLVSSAGAGVGPNAFMVESGNSLFNGKCSNNTVDSCLFKIDKGSAVLFQDRVDGLTMTNTTGASRLSSALVWTGSGGTNPSDNVTLLHNTFYSDGGKAFDIDWGSGNSPGSSWTGNLFYRRGTGGCVMDAFSPFNSSASLVYRADGNTSAARGDGSCSATDSRATWGNPAFTDTAWATLNLLPQAGSAAFSGAFPGGYAGALQATSADVTAPAAVSTMEWVSGGGTTAGLVFEQTGDDGSSGAAASYIMRFAAPGDAYPIPSGWSSMRSVGYGGVLWAEPSPGLAGTSGEYSVSGLSAGTYYFVTRAYDDAGNLSDFGNVVEVVAAGAGGDLVRPASISDLAVRSPWNGFVRLLWTTVGDDSLSGTATAYDVRYRLGETITSATWDDTVHSDANTAPVQGRTYFFRYPVSDMPAPVVAGTAQYCEAAFQPGRSVYFAMKVADDAGNWSAMSNVESTTVRVAADTSQSRWPRRFVYGVAAPTQTAGNTISKAWPLLYYDSLTVNTVETAKLAQNDVVCVNQDAAAQDSFVAAVRDMRARNPRIKILVGISLDAAYRQDNPDTLYDTSKIDGWRLSYYRTWKMLANITPWPTNFAKPYSATYGTPAGYTASADSITPSAWAWARGLGRKNVLLGTATGAWTASAGNTTRNVNIGYRDANGRYLVAESLAVLHKELFYDRTYTERDGSTRRLFDGTFQDLHSFYNTTDPHASYGDSLDWRRMSAFGSGYANRAEANQGWTDGAVRYDVRLRELTPEWTWYGSNDGTGNNFTASGGYMREAFYGGQGGSWFTNAFWTPGGGFHDEGMHTQRPQFNTVFSFPSTSTVGDSGMASNYWPDTTTWSQKDYRLGLGSAQLWGAHFVYAYSKGSIHHMQTHAAGGYYSWGFDEQAVNRRTGQAIAMSSVDSAGWLGAPLGPAYFHYPSATGAIFTEDFKSGSAADSSQWGGLTKGADGLVTVRPTTYDGQASVGGNSFMLEMRPVRTYHPNYDWKVAATGGSAGRFPVANSTAITVSFYARADSARWLNVSARDSLAAAIKAGNESPMRVWVGTTWAPYAIRIVPSVGSSRRAELVLSVGDTLGRVLVTGIQVHTGDSVQAIREFQHGAVVVNPGTTGKSHTFARLTRRLLKRTGTTNSLNNGEWTRTLTTPAGDASFVLWVQDSLRPAPITGLSMSCPCAIGQVSWTATGDDSLTGVPERYEVRRSLSAIATESDWSNATLVWTDAAGVQAQGVTLRTTVPGLARNTKYYVAVRAYDEADQPTPIVSDSFTTGNCRARRRQWF